MQATRRLRGQPREAPTSPEAECHNSWTLVWNSARCPLCLYPADAATSITGQVFIAAGGFVARYDRPQPTVLGFRDRTTAPPWSHTDLHRMITGTDTETPTP
ncbi:hypothetical protein [Nocardia paucivorans]|uniref:hypothetical protein n=1 Tax=Nocardia paucivorans TaxID=114259 RepID=UPI0002D3A78D|nr:hypothetical protein [Nocardia paucivorans]